MGETRYSGRKVLNVIQGEPVLDAPRRAVRDALLEHKRVGNTIASWKGGKVVIIPAEEIPVEEVPADSDRSEKD
jgi:hypothetical protein